MTKTVKKQSKTKKYKAKTTVVAFQSESKSSAEKNKFAVALFGKISKGISVHVTGAEIKAAFASAGLSIPEKVEIEMSRHEEKQGLNITVAEFCELFVNEIALIERLAKDNFVVPRFDDFKIVVGDVFDTVNANETGDVADYIPQLARVNPDYFALSVCTIDGQRANYGDHDKHYCVQSTCKPVNYALALTLNGTKKVHKHVGREPSGQSFNELMLNNQGLPHNPMINAGAIMSGSLIHPEWPLADRFDFVMNTWTALAGGIEPRFSNAIFLSEKATADRNYALAHFMQEKRAFPEGTDLAETLELYFQSCSIEVTTQSMSVIAATLANGGVNPITSMRIFSEETVKHCLSLMYSCGMYDFSGEFAFRIGLPAKSGVSGAMFVVVPGVMGFAIWSPRLDHLGNSVRGVEFCQQLTKRLDLSEITSSAVSTSTDDASMVFRIIQSAANNDIHEMTRLIAHGVDINVADYDGRTPLHLAVSERHCEASNFLLAQGADANFKDRWGLSPLDEAKQSGFSEIFKRKVIVANNDAPLHQQNLPTKIKG